MTILFIARRFALLLAVILPLAVHAVDRRPYTLPVNYSFRYTGNAAAMMEIINGDSGSLGYATANASESPYGTAWMQPGKTYRLYFRGFGSVGQYWISLTAPSGYKFYVNGVPKDLIYKVVNNSMPLDYYDIELRPDREGSLAQGAFTGIDIGQAIAWSLGLGTLRAGHSAGRLGFHELDLSNVSRDRLVYFDMPLNSTQVNIIKDGSSATRIRQIVAPRIMVDVVDVFNGYEVRYYNYDDTTWNSSALIYTINTGKTPWRTIFVEAPASTTNQLRITETDETSSSTARVSHLSLTSGTISSGNYLLTLQEGGAGGNWLRTTTHSSVKSGGIRENFVTVREGGTGGTIITETKYVYKIYAWGEDLFQVIDNPNGGMAALTTTYAYHEIAPTATSETYRGNYCRLKAVSDSTGNWIATEYYDEWNKRGQVKYQYQPHLDSPNTVTLSPTQGRVTYYEYTADLTGRDRLLALKQEKINNVETAKAVWTYDNSPNTGLARIKAYVDSYYGSGTSSYLRTRTESIDTLTSDVDQSGEPCVVKKPDAAQTSWSRSAGNFNLSTRVFTVNSSGMYWRAVKINGSSAAGPANGAEASTQSSFSAQSFDPLYLVPNQSTAEVTVLDCTGLPLRTETWVYTGGGSWSTVPVGYVDYEYDFVRTNRLKSKISINGAGISYQYTNGRISSTVVDGVETQFTYDALGRTLTKKKIGAAASGIHAAQADITTTYNYNATDGANYATTETISAGGTTETIVSSTSYDRAGRVVKITPPGLGGTTFSYNIPLRTQTATAPDKGTTIVATYADGSQKSVTGTGVVAQYQTHFIEIDGRRRMEVYVGGDNSPRLQQIWTDWLGRRTKLQKPGFARTNQDDYVEEHFYHATTGQLIKDTRSGTAPTRYEYNAIGQVKRSGLDVNSDDALTLNSMDRISDSNSVFEYLDNAWWTKNTVITYPDDNAGSHPIMTVNRVRQTGFAAGVRSETQTVDAEGNIATTVSSQSGKLAINRTSISGLTVSDAYAYVYNSLASASTGHDGLTTRIEYDALGRLSKSYDARNLTTSTTYYENTTLPYKTKDSTNTVVRTVGYTAEGRTAWKQDALSMVTRFAYNQRGQLTSKWGGGTYPIAYAYDATYGERVGMSTYRDGPDEDSVEWPTVGAGDTTIWEYDQPTGMLWRRTDAANKSVIYDYDQAGRISRRTWARGVYVDYAYYPETGELRTKTYSDDTPAVAYSYTRSGQINNITDYTGTWDYIYDLSKPWRRSAVGLPAFYGSRTWTLLYENSGMVGRYLGFQLGASAGDSGDLEQRYAYSADGRLDTLTTKRSNGNATRTFDYSYFPNTAFVCALSTLSGAGSDAFTLTRDYESNRNILASIEGKWGSSTITRYDYTYDAKGQRTTAKQSGSAFADYYVSGSYSSVFTHYLYNGRGELQSAAMYHGDIVSLTPDQNAALPGRRFEYRFDSIGNRKNDGPTGDPNNIDDCYTTNSLNQYINKENNTVRFLGTIAANANLVVADSIYTNKKDRAWGSYIVPANSTTATSDSGTVYAAIPGGGPGGTDLIRSDTKAFFIPKSLQSFSYDDDGNLLSDGVWTYTYDAENRLVAMEHCNEVIGTGMVPTSNARRLKFEYDHQGRRVRKTVYGWSSWGYSATPIADTKYLYDGWNLVAEFYVNGSNLTLSRSYTWGLDMADSLIASGGVGALLQIYDSASGGKTFLTTYDGIGNLAALLDDDTGERAATYEYDPFGSVLRAEGIYATANPFRFSTKFTDLETGLAYYGLRYYSPSLGRFINRDPIDEGGGANLYAYCSNDGINAWDFLGMWEDDTQFWRHINPRVPRADPRTARILGYAWGGALGGMVLVAAGPVALPVIYSSLEYGTALGMAAVIRGSYIAYGMTAYGAYYATQTSLGVRSLFIAGATLGVMGAYAGRDYLEGFPDEIAQTTPFGWGNAITYNLASWFINAHSRWGGGSAATREANSPPLASAPTGLASGSSGPEVDSGGVTPLVDSDSEVMIMDAFDVVTTRDKRPGGETQGVGINMPLNLAPGAGMAISVQGDIYTRSLLAWETYWISFGNSVANGTPVDDQFRNLATAHLAGFSLQGYEWLFRRDLPAGLLPSHLYFARAALRVGDLDSASAALRAYEVTLLTEELRSKRRD